MLEDQQKPSIDVEQQKAAIRIESGREERISFLAAMIDELERESPEDMGVRGRKGVLAAITGDRETALRIFEWLGRLDKPYMRGSNISRQAAIAAALGEK